MTIYHILFIHLRTNKCWVLPLTIKDIYVWRLWEYIFGTLMVVEYALFGKSVFNFMKNCQTIFKNGQMGQFLPILANICNSLFGS